MEPNKEISVDIINKLKAESVKATNTGTYSALGALTAALAVSLIPGVGAAVIAAIGALGAGVTSASLTKKLREERLSLDIQNMLNDIERSKAVIEAINKETSKFKADEFDLEKMRRTIDELKAKGLIAEKNENA